MTIDSGIVKSVSSVLVLGNKTLRAVVGQNVDQLAYSDDMGIRSIYFQVGGRRIPEGRAISYSKDDPELYVLGFRHQDPANISQVPSMRLFDNEGLIGNSRARGWQFRFDLRDALSGYADGLQMITGSFSVNVSTLPESPKFLSTPPAPLTDNNSLECFYFTDQVMEIHAGGVRMTLVW